MFCMNAFLMGLFAMSRLTELRRQANPMRIKAGTNESCLEQQGKARLIFI